MAVMPVIGFSVMRQNASANTLIQTIIPDEYRGRVMAMYSMTVVGIGPLGSLAAGALAGPLGPRFTVLAGGILALGAAALYRVQARRTLSEIE
jgi:MFS family permease